ncbi:putative membrane protein YdjX (TVP38/TMEM64 family) [Pontibacter aydingkolensis]|uniref:TVP38/TMEM64 family membrane protein n=1 Tax=Pontibacter aydingkolensis TaxID=1911536 RepID=A0ABS7CSE5_9BACT|nr:TVP38/TMEM64 family protein [Pontibacter aydingkolensis]MBW7466769.1 TVP38/TMEM64 family protein [Pontibacter aydingkolensis]
MNSNKQKEKNTHPRKYSYDQKTTEDNSHKQSKWPLIITLILIASLVASYFIFPGFQKEVDTSWDVLTSGDRQRISDWVEQFGFWGPFFIILAMIAQMFLLVINVVALMLVSIIAYGPVWGTLVAITAVVVASTVGYLIGRGVGKAGVSKLIGPKTEHKVMNFVDDYGLWAVMIARISPFLSNDAISIVAGLAKMNYFRFIGATLAGIVPLAILLAWLGENNERLKTGLIWVSAVSIAAFIGYIIYDKYIRSK